ncbi:uncharacterized protein [Henckelia pumila]|uniref:uncharacterized protein isoform X5 n=1 Tax=Henckelia pumila TaxID=405737 RepID=UPI003C6E9434
MAIVLRFVDCEGFLMKRFFDIVHVADTTAVTLKKEICNVLGRHGLHIKDIRGQGYDGASNMRGSWNGLQALFLRDSPQAYYVHCFAHRLQLELVGAAEKESSIWLFFSKLTSVCNLIKASPKRHTELQSAQAIEIANMVATGIYDTGTGLNQIGTLQRAEKFYPGDFNGQELHYLRSQLVHYKVDNIHNERFQNISTISELCRRLVETEKAKYYQSIDKLIRLVLTLPVSTATTERLFSAMKLLKTSLRNKMEEEFLTDSMIVYIEREFTAKIDTDSIIDEFYSMKNRRAHLQ